MIPPPSGGRSPPKESNPPKVGVGGKAARLSPIIIVDWGGVGGLKRKKDPLRNNSSIIELEWKPYEVGGD